MKTYKALVRNKETGEAKTIESSYSRKADFVSDLRANGYSIVNNRVATKECYDWNTANNRDGYDWLNDREYRNLS